MIFMHTTGPFWSQATAADPEGLGRLIRDHGKLLAPFVKTNNSQSAEHEVGAVLALWKASPVASALNPRLGATPRGSDSDYNKQKTTHASGYFLT